MDAFEILVIILAVSLAIFLVLGIIATILIIKILRQVQLITTKAQSAVDYAENTARTLMNAATPAFIAQALVKQAKKAFRGK